MGLEIGKDPASVSDIIIRKIQQQGPLSFKEFMEAALYYPKLGYYTSSKPRIGANGDYFTSCSLGPVFGAMIARQLNEMVSFVGEPSFTVLEYGSGTGLLCDDILDYLHLHHPSCFEKMNYGLVEKRMGKEKARKSRFPAKVSSYSSISELGSFTGCVLSNELLDNFPVHQVVMEDQLMEVFVGFQEGFYEILKPASPALVQYLEELKVKLPRNFRTEINLQALDWIEEISAHLHKGYILTIDYGFPSADLYSQRRRNGTLICYRSHSVTEDPYQEIGEQDITSHVNFSALYRNGLKNGLKCCGFTKQSYFLLSLGFKEYLIKTLGHLDLVQAIRRERFLSQTLLLDMGNKLKVLVQSKGMGMEKLTGLKFQIDLPDQIPSIN
jgi:SAM-dependent MidA family methyltransferase